MSDFADSTRPVREGEELDAAKLRAYLADTLGGEADIAVEQFPGGHSNLTYLVRHGEDEYVLRRPPFGSKVKTAHDMGREYRVLSKLSKVYSRAPRPIAMCEDESIIGAKFYLMQRLRGVILRKRLPDGMTLDAPTARRLCEVLIETLAELHGLDYEAIGLGDFGRPAGYIQRQISGWTKRYAGSRTDDIPSVDRVAEWLAANQPADGKPSLIHNDFKFDNLVLDANDLTKVIGILDWEMSTIGDPLMDFGTSLCYWIQESDPQALRMMAFGITTAPGMMTRRELVEAYAKATGADVSDIIFYYAYGLFKTAVVAQQIYYRFHEGLTKDPRFGQFIFAVRLMADKAAESIESGEL
jgi:aminoglycoside phosphotransferase (APT) family kinase protein